MAQEIGAEIVSADSRQVYRGMDVGTATPSMSERGGVPHHLLNVLDPDQKVTAGWFLDAATEVIGGLRSRGRPVVVVGGSTLYVHALLEGLAPLPSLDPARQSELAARAESPEGRRAMFAELERLDPIAAQTLDASKSQRLTRLLGLVHQLERPVSELWEQHGGGLAGFVPSPSLIVVERPRLRLYARVNQRACDMVNNGLLDEITNLLRQWPGSRTILETTIGYREMIPVLEEGADLSEAVRLVQRNSRRYAKRQLTWYRRYPDARWLDAGTATVADVLAA